MRLRPATPADFPVLAEIVATGYRDAFGTILSQTALAERTAAHFARRFASETVPPVLAEDETGRPIGFHLTHGGTLHMLFVDTQLQSRGAGAALLADAERRGAVRLECFRDNRAARAFYEKRGWVHARDYTREFVGDVYAFVEYVKPAN